MQRNLIFTCSIAFTCLIPLTFVGHAQAQAPEPEPAPPLEVTAPQEPPTEPEAGEETPSAPQDGSDPPAEAEVMVPPQPEPAAPVETVSPPVEPKNAPTKETKQLTPPPALSPGNGKAKETTERRFSVNPSGYFQVRAERSSTEDRSDPYSDDPQAETSYAAAFSIGRAVVRLTGYAHAPALTYRVQANLGALQFDLEDAYLNYRFAKHLEIRAGKHKRPFSRQFLTPLSNLQFASPSYMQEHFGPTRDVGVLIHNDYLDGHGFEYALGVYQGRSESVQYFSNYEGTAVHLDRETSDTLPSNMEPTVAFRLGYSGGPGTYSEGHLEGKGSVAGVAMSGLFDVNANESNDSRAQVEVDFIFKVDGFSFSTGIFAEMRQTGPRFFKNREHGAGGLTLQGGYLIGGVFEPIVRLQAIMAGEGPDPSSEPYSRTASTLGFNLYFKGHSFKWVNEVTLAAETEVRGQPEDAKERITLALSQAQVAF